MSARVSLSQTLAVLADCLSDFSLIDKAPAEIAHNARARMLRQGLAVLVFSTLETFVRERTAEVLRSFTNPALSFADLSPSLQKATTLGALDGVRFRLKLQPSTQKISWLIANLGPILSAPTNVGLLSEHSFGHSRSNLAEDDVADILRCFGIETPWSQVTSLAGRCGIAILDAKSEFEAMQNRRHASAHALTGHVPFTDLENSVRSALATCMAFDLLLSHAGALINKKIFPGQGGRPALKHGDVKLVFVEPRASSGKFAVAREHSIAHVSNTHRRAAKLFAASSDAIAYGEQYAASRESQLVVIGDALTPINWKTWH